MLKSFCLSVWKSTVTLYVQLYQYKIMTVSVGIGWFIYRECTAIVCIVQAQVPSKNAFVINTFLLYTKVLNLYFMSCYSDNIFQHELQPIYI